MFLYGPCLCASPDCPSCGPAQGWHVHTRHCADENGLYACGLRTYDDPEPTCGYCGDVSDTDICAVCQEQMEREEEPAS